MTKHGTGMRERSDWSTARERRTEQVAGAHGRHRHQQARGRQGQHHLHGSLHRGTEPCTGAAQCINAMSMTCR